MSNPSITAKQIEQIGTDFVGKPADKEALAKAFPGFVVHVLPLGAIVTMDYRLDRIRVWTDESDNVVEFTNG